MIDALTFRGFSLY